jgi:hypothetical protein
MLVRGAAGLAEPEIGEGLLATGEVVSRAKSSSM